MIKLFAILIASAFVPEGANAARQCEFQCYKIGDVVTRTLCLKDQVKCKDDQFQERVTKGVRKGNKKRMERSLNRRIKARKKMLAKQKALVESSEIEIDSLKRQLSALKKAPIKKPKKEEDKNKK